MEEALRFFRAFEVWIYLLLGLGGLFYARKFILAWQELRGAAFGLERESAQARLNQAASVLVLILTMTVSVFILVSFIAPTVPGANPLLTPTLDLLATPTTTLAAFETPVDVESPDETPTPILPPIASGCMENSILITSPTNGSEVRGVVQVLGTADIPNFGFYKFEMKRPEDNVWLTIQAGNQPVQSGDLGDWDTRRLTPGEYQLGLVVVDNQGRSSEPCIVQVSVVMVVETPGP